MREGCCRALPSRMLRPPSQADTTGGVIPAIRSLVSARAASTDLPRYACLRRRARGRRAAGVGPGGGRLRVGRGLGGRLVLGRVEAAGVLLRRGLAARVGRRRARARARGGRRRAAGGRVLLILRGADQLAARRGVAAVERLRDERVLRCGPVAAEAALDAAHVVAPDVGREGAAVDVAAEVEAVHLDVVLRVADPDRGGQARREADEPGVRVGVGGARLAAGRAADLGVRAGAALDVLLEDLATLRGDAVGEDLRPLHAEALRQPLAGLHAPVGERDLLDRGRAHAVAAVGDARVRGRHLERRDAVLEAPERLGRVALERRLDAHHPGGVLDVVRPEVHRELDVDGVVGLERALAQAHGAAAGAAVGPDLELAVLRVVDQRRRDRRVVRRVRVHAHAQRGHQRHDLERRARAPVTLRGKVEVGLPVVARGGHRLDVAVLRVERDDRRRGPDAGQVVRDRVARLLLLVEVDRRVDLHPALAHRLRAVLLEQLVLDVVEEVLLAAAGEVGAQVDAELRLDRLLRAFRADHLEVGHLAQHLVAALLGGARRAGRRVVRRRLRETGEEGGLLEREVLDLLREVDPGGGLDADRRLPADGAVRDRVEVLLEDPLLRVLVLQLLGQLRLADLALVGALAGDVERAHELHRDRGAALHGLARREVLDRRAHDALVVDALALVEALVLDRDRRVLDHVGDLGGAQRQVQLLGLDEPQRLAVSCEDARVIPRRLRLERGQGRRGGRDGDDVADRTESAERRHDGHDHQGEEELAARRSAAAAPAPGALGVGHREG